MSKKLPPVVVDLGKQKKKQVEELERGGGDVAIAIEQALAEFRAKNGTIDAANVLPVVLIYRQKDDSVKLPGMLGLLAGG